MWQVPLADVVVSEQDIDEVVETYRSGWLSMGPRTEELERAFAEYVGVEHAFAVANGTAALHLSYLACGLGTGDRVLVPSLTFVATINAIMYTGAEPVFVDISGVTQPWLDAGAVEAAIDDRTRAIVSVSYGGHPGAVEELARIADEHSLPLIEDAAHAAGSRVGRRHLGTFGAAGAFSFFSNKNLAVGEGGMVITNDEDIGRRTRLLRSHGMTSLTWDRHRGHASTYDVVELGFNYRIDEPRAALTLSRLRRLDEENERRAAITANYRQELSDVNGVEMLEPAPAGAVDASHLFAIVLDRSIDRARFRNVLAERGVQTSVHYPPAHRFAIYDHLAADLPITEDYAARTVTLPLFPHMTADQLAHVVDSVHRGLA